MIDVIWLIENIPTMKFGDRFNMSRIVKKVYREMMLTLAKNSSVVNIFDGIRRYKIYACFIKPI